MVLQGVPEPQWDEQVSRTYIGYAQYLEAMFNARNEIYIGKVFGSRYAAKPRSITSLLHMPTMRSMSGAHLEQQIEVSCGRQ